MKITMLFCTVLLSLIASLTAAQNIAPSPSILCSPSPRVPFTNWAQYQFDPCHSGYNPWEFILNSSNVRNLVLDWSDYTGPIADSAPTVANGMVYIATAYERQGPQYLYAFDAQSGTLIWTFEENANGPVHSSAAVAGGVVYYGGQTGLYALNAATGVPIWSVPTEVPVSPPAVVDGVVYAEWGSGEPNLTRALYALNAATGTVIWKHSFDVLPVQIYGVSASAVASGIVYATLELYWGGNSVYALNAATGAVLWEKAIYGAAAAPSVANNLVYVPSVDQNIYAFNAYSGALIWKYKTTGFPYYAAAVAKGVLYVGADYLYALNAANGTLLWKSDFILGNGTAVTSPVVANGVVYTEGNWYDLVALDASTGALLWKYTTSYGVGGTPTVANGILYVGTAQKPTASDMEDSSTGDDSSSLLAFHLPN
ncbi:MAG: PQQ-binding-like beta-propeller repeat protein [Candidatus Korobacteraceae bacterium]